MSEQRQHDSVSEVLGPPTDGGDPSTSAARLAAVRTELDSVFAAADAILDGIRQGDSERFLQQVRQSGGQ